MYKIKTMNAISPLVNDLLSTDKYIISSEEPTPDAILVRSAVLQDSIIADPLLAIARAGAGTNNIPVDVCSKKGVVVFNTPGANANAVAELVMAGMLLSCRDIAGGINWAQSLQGQTDVAKLVEKGKSKFEGPELKDKTFGVIGLGAIGALVANTAANGFGMEVLGYDPYISVEHAWSLSRAIRRADCLEDVVGKCDFISIHVPLADNTKKLVNAAFIAGMKKGARLLNFSRAELVDAAAVKEALASGQLAAYVTDFPTEELLGVKGIICLPHLGASTPESEDRCAKMAASELRDYIEYGIIRNSVNMPEIVLGIPEGSRVLLIHENVPGLVSSISAVISGRGINILNMLNKSRGNIAVTVLELSQAPDSVLTASLQALKQVVRVRILEA